MLYSLQNDRLTVTVNTRGAEPWSLKAADGTEFLWQGHPGYWRDRAIHIFPYVARLTEGRYTVHGGTYAMQTHGLARYCEFRVTEQTERQMTFELTDSAETRVAYPFGFSFRVVYRLEGDTVHITYEVESRDEKTMYFGLGGHPGFCVPLAAGKVFSDYRVRFSKPCAPRRVGFTADRFRDGTVTDYPLEHGTTLPLRHDLFDDDAIIWENVDDELTLETDGDIHAVTVRFPDMPYLGLWHAPRTDAPYLCIEPWRSLPALHGGITDLATQPDLVSLPAGGTYRNTWSIRVRF